MQLPHCRLRDNQRDGHEDKAVQEAATTTWKEKHISEEVLCERRMLSMVRGKFIGFSSGTNPDTSGQIQRMDTRNKKMRESLMHSELEALSRARSSKQSNGKHVSSLYVPGFWNRLQRFVSNDWETSCLAKLFYGDESDSGFAKEISSSQAYLYSSIS
ncbi:hypothetical protein F2Q70_00002998 [Brassica cretica]|uniref:Uncharacterized protein n=1 Tax=Brassica cretica TaxID=69181 RepID=A0A3N6Q7C1_BRACR|nr:hypothetical protein F2Q70_00002998 [Brassica cretica]KAF3560898.1 hypothetical protein DY000_02014666 [Brassica cretica]